MCRGGRPDLELVFGNPCSRDAGSFRVEGRESTEEEALRLWSGGPGAHRPRLLGSEPPYSAFCVSCGQLSVWDGVLVSWGWACGGRVQGPRSPRSITAAVCAISPGQPAGPDTVPQLQGSYLGGLEADMLLLLQENVFFAANVCVVGMAM